MTSLPRPCTCFFRTFLVLLLSLTGSGFLYAQSQDEDELGEVNVEELLAKALKELPRLSLSPLKADMEVDGKLSEAVWHQANHLIIKRESYPAFLSPAPVETMVKVMLVDESLWIGFDCIDPEPDLIQAPLRDRDGIEKDDYVGISIDPDGKRIRSFEFYISASGVQADWSRNQVEDRRSMEWDANWEGASSRHERGYSAELRIPLRELPLSTDVEKRLLVLKRHYPRKVRHYLSSVALILPQKQDQEVVKSGWNLIPSFTVEPSRERDLDDSASTWDNSVAYDVGLDAQYWFNTNWNGAITINPNFLEVEADLTSSSINDPFTSLDPEKRPFFLQGSDVFGTPFDLVYTRNIQNPVVGAQLFGRQDQGELGSFVTGDRELSVIVPGNLSSERVDLDQDSVSGSFRIRHDHPDGASIGLISTHREGQEGYYNHVIGTDMYLKQGRNHAFRGQWLYSSTRYDDSFFEDLYEPPEGIEVDEDTGIPGETGLSESVLRAAPNQTLNDDAWMASYKYKPRAGHLTLLYRDVGEEFRGDLGYMPRVDYRQALLSGGVNYYFSRGRANAVSRLRLSTVLYHMDSQSGESLNTTRELWLNYWGLFQSWVRVGYRDRDRIGRRINQASLDLENNARMENEQQWILRTESALSKQFRFSFEGRFGSAIDTDNYRVGNLIEVEPEIRWNSARHLELFIKNTYRSLDVSDGEVFEENYLRLGFTYQLQQGSFLRFTLIDDLVFRNPDLYLFEEVSGKERDSSMELVFAWKPSKLNTLILGMNSNASDDSQRESPGLDWDEINLFLKFSRNFDLR